MNEKNIKCVVCASKTKEAKDLVITSTVQGREIVITGLTGDRCPECGEQYVDTESSRKALKIAANFRKPAIVFKRKVTVSEGRRVKMLTSGLKVIRSERKFIKYQINV